MEWCCQCQKYVLTNTIYENAIKLCRIESICSQCGLTLNITIKDINLGKECSI